MVKHTAPSNGCVRERHGRGILPDYGDILAAQTE